MEKLILGLAMLVLITLVATLSATAVSEEECVAGNGTWTTPIVNQGGDPVPQKILQPYCKCETGFYWNDSAASCVDDTKLRCEQTQGVWVDDQCQCPEGTIKWTTGFGCDAPGPVPLGNDAEQESDISEKNIFSSYILVGIGLLLVGLVIYFIRRRSKNENQ